MLSSIHPLGERARNNRYWVTVAAYAIGSVAGGVVLGLAAGGLGALLHTGGPPSLLAGGLLALLAAALETGRVQVPLPGPRRQVDERWLDEYRGWVYGIGFGVQLGLGVTTIITTAAVHLMVALAVLGGSVGTGAAIGAVFGLVRALPAATTAEIETPEALRRFHRRLAVTAPAVRTAAVVVLVGVGAGLIVQGAAGA
ncbi:MAG TPA: hypothetical protein VM618_13355 [Acidimicrobiia bacterium]|nr:hypothetical protein [Acidimicrobiia bacterium]